MNHQDRGCLTKRVYLSEIDAMMTARFREAAGSPPLHAYKCQYCGFHHLAKVCLLVPPVDKT